MYNAIKNGINGIADELALFAVQPVPKKKDVICHSCKQSGHYSDKCPNKPINKKLICYNCKQEGHYKDKCPNNKTKCFTSTTFNGGDKTKCFTVHNFDKNGKFVLTGSSTNMSTKTIYTTIKFGQMDGPNSVLIETNSDLYNLKSEIILKLMEFGIISDADLDNRNKKAHVDIKGKQEIYNKLNNTKIAITANSFQINKNLIEIDLDKNTTAGKLDTFVHYTLIYKVDISKHREIIEQVISLVLDKLGKDSIEKKEIKNDIKNEINLCGICLSEPYDHMIDPCGHVCICKECSKIVTTKCPICNGPVKSIKKVFLS